MLQLSITERLEQVDDFRSIDVFINGDDFVRHRGRGIFFSMVEANDREVNPANFFGRYAEEASASSHATSSALRPLFNRYIIRFRFFGMAKSLRYSTLGRVIIGMGFPFASRFMGNFVLPALSCND